MTSEPKPTEAPVLDWKRYRALTIPLDVRFASRPQNIQTLEGPVECTIGDAILTGVKGETWPVPHKRFMDTYAPVPPTRLGQAGRYAKKPSDVWAGRLAASHEVTLSGNRGVLYGHPGDILIEYSDGDQAIVAADIFNQTYQLLDA